MRLDSTVNVLVPTPTMVPTLAEILRSRYVDFVAAVRRHGEEFENIHKSSGFTESRRYAFQVNRSISVSLQHRDSTQARMPINPYASPSIDIDPIGPASRDGSPHAFDPVEITRVVRALRLIRWGDSVQLLSTGMLGLLFYFRSPVAKALSTLSATVTLSFLCTGVLLSFVGLLLLTSHERRHRSISIFAIALQSIGAVSVASFVASIQRSQFIGGLMPLFGAAAFAMLLTSMAIVALVVRTHLTTNHPVKLVGWGNAAVICYALCATLASALSLHVLPSAIPTTMVLVLIFVAGWAALSFRIAELGQAIALLADRQDMSTLD